MNAADHDGDDFFDEDEDDVTQLEMMREGWTWCLFGPMISLRRERRRTRTAETQRFLTSPVRKTPPKRRESEAKAIRRTRSKSREDATKRKPMAQISQNVVESTRRCL